MISDLQILTCQKHGLLKFFIKTFQANLYVFAILIAFYIHYKSYGGILGKTSKMINPLEMVCAEFKCKTDIINISKILQNLKKRFININLFISSEWKNGMLEYWG